MKATPILISLTILALSSCKSSENKLDASGTFEAEETIISSEASGIIKQLDIEEGQNLESGQYIGYIDSVQLYLRKKQVDAQIHALLARRPDIASQLASLQEQLKSAEKDQERITNLIKANAAAARQLDDAATRVDVLKKQIEAQRSALGITNAGISGDAQSLQVQVDQLSDQLSKCRLINPVKGTVLTQYSKVNEVAAPGKPLYRIADLSTIILRVYVTGNQLSTIKINQPVKVLADDGAEKYKSYDGMITWINDKAEFTPKSIQTKEERANMVYAVKVKVKNDGLLKIGMYGGIMLQ